MFFTFRGRQMHYEVHGEGRPLLLFNGIMMSCASWAPFLEAFRQGGNQLLLIDLIDQGRSAAFPEGYSLADQAELALALLDHLGLERINVMGTSYGGAAALTFACAWPERVGRLMLAGTRAWSDPLFQGMCQGWLKAAASPEAFYDATIPLFYGATFQRGHADWMAARRELLLKGVFSNPEFLARMSRLVRSFMTLDLRERLGRIACPTLVVSAAEDLVMMPWEQERIAAGIPGSLLVTLHRTGHVMFLERPDLFIPLMMGWFNHPGAVALP